jgi:hypothetical protein
MRHSFDLIRVIRAIRGLAVGRFKRYAWPASVVASGLLLYASRDQMPPGTDLVGALMSLFGLGQQISASVSERIFERIGAIASKQAELTKVADNHATVLKRHQQYFKSLSRPEAVLDEVLRPAS